MTEAMTLRTFDLPGGTLLPFHSAPGARVRILYGRIWMTEEGSKRDAFLASGEEVALGTRGLAVIEALGPARVQLIDNVSVTRMLIEGVRRVGQALGAWWLRQSCRQTRTGSAANALLRQC
jgi:Protein of unknown function (DUF2917)